jgi:hypothetical protein
MGGFSAQIQPSQSSSPAGKNAGLSSMQLGMDPIEQSPQDQLLQTQQLQAEQPNFAQANQIQPNLQNGTQLGGLGGALGNEMNPYQANLQGIKGKGGSPSTMGMMGGKITLPGQGGQPELGMPNAYSNTIQPWDNQPNKPTQGLGGKGLGNAVNQAKPMSKGA